MKQNNYINEKILVELRACTVAIGGLHASMEYLRHHGLGAVIQKRHPADFRPEWEKAIDRLDDLKRQRPLPASIYYHGLSRSIFYKVEAQRRPISSQGYYTWGYIAIRYEFRKDISTPNREKRWQFFVEKTFENASEIYSFMRQKFDICTISDSEPPDFYSPNPKPASPTSTPESRPKVRRRSEPGKPGRRSDADFLPGTHDASQNKTTSSVPSA